MPVHDWTRVTAGTWHAFHLSWTSEIQVVLNKGLLPPDYYAQAEQIIGTMGPDVLTLRNQNDPTSNGTTDHHFRSTGHTAVATEVPQTRFTAQTEMDDYLQKQRTIVIRHSSDDQIIALIELVSPGNKSGKQAIQSFVEKAVEALYRGYHLLIVDLFPPSVRDPEGIPALIWNEFAEVPYHLPDDERLTLSSYEAGRPKRLYVETSAVGMILQAMPLFLEPGNYVKVPLEATYNAAFEGVPRKWQQVLK